MVFGRDLTQIPCFRDSALNGIYSGIAAVLITVMATSRPRLAADTGVYTFCIVTLGSFVVCRYKREQTKKMISAVEESRKEGLKDNMNEA